jgi:glyoxylase-like metal-dependent hydrolase (beta-lactamase superfamily II)
VSVAIPFNRETGFTPGRVDQVSPLIRRVLAPNPSAFTFMGTNSYIVGTGTVAIIDPGPAIAAHGAALLAAVAGERVSHILVTHTHIDHSPLAAALKTATGAVVAGHGPHGAGKAEEGVVVEEGGDMEFDPELKLRDGDRVSGPGWTLEAVFTPGHCSNHLCYALAEERSVFTGDHVMSWSTSVVVPPDGDMAQYMASLDKLRERQDQVLWPAHGGPIRTPGPFLEAFIAHRQDREAQILTALGAGPSAIPALVARIYTDVDRSLHPAAARSVHAHLIRMVQDGRARSDGAPTAGATYRI